MHLNMLSCANIVPLLASLNARSKPKIIVHSHNSDMPREKGVTSAVRRLLHFCNLNFVAKKSDVRLACSTEAGIFMFGKNKNFLVLNNAIDTNRYTFDMDLRREIRRRLGADDATVVIGHTGRFEWQKNQQFAIRVFAQYLKLNSRAMLVLVGKGSMEEECKELAQELEISGKVVFYGLAEQDKIPALLCAFDIFIFPSRFEGLSLSGVEALCTGLPVLASDSVSKEMDVTGNVVYKSLDDADWVKEIDRIVRSGINRCEGEAYSGERKKYAQIVKKSGYDISENANKLKKIWIESDSQKESAK